jgi:lysophospholipid acyltransferase
MIGILDKGFAYLAPYVGLSKDQFKLVTILYIAVPLCGILKRLPDNKPHLKNVFNIRYDRFGALTQYIIVYTTRSV